MNIDEVSKVQFSKSVKPQQPTPPPGGNIENRRPPSEPTAPPDRGSNGTSNEIKVNYSSLRTLQEILADYSDVSKLETGQRAELNARLNKSGLLVPGALIDARV